MSIFFCCLALVMVLPSFLTYLLYCYEETNQTTTTLLHCVQRAFPGFLSSIWGQVLICLLYPLPIPRAQPLSNSKGVVVLVHGLFHNSSAWWFFQHWLRKHHFQTLTFSYSSWQTSFSQTAEQLSAFLKTQAQEYPEQKIHVVGHSLGGLLLRAALGNMSHEEAKTFASLTTLGTPYKGSKLAPFAFNSLGRCLRYQGPEIQALQAQPFPEHIKATALYSPVDNLVLPQEALICVHPAWQHISTSPISHVSMLFSKKIFHQVLALFP